MGFASTGGAASQAVRGFAGGVSTLADRLDPKVYCLPCLSAVLLGCHFRVANRASEGYDNRRLTTPNGDSMRLTSSVAATAILILSACRTDGGTAPVDSDFTLRNGQVLSVDDTGVRIRLLGVPEDSRCAQDVQCVWSGNAVVELEVRATGMTDTLALNTHVGAKDGTVGEYMIRLVSLAPAPLSTRQIEQSEYRATLRVTRVPVVCTAEARSAITVAVSDSLDPSVTSFTNVRIVAQSGNVRDSAFIAQLKAPQNQYAAGLAYEQAGVYTVTVRADGYAPWSKSGIEVTRDACHVTTVIVHARLVR